MTTIHTSELEMIVGGVARGQSREQIRERYQNECLSPDPVTARKQYDILVKQMVPDASEAPGIKRRAVRSIGQLCHWPLPK